LNRADVAARLRAAGCVAADDEAACLFAGAHDAATLERWLRRRVDGEPLAWIVGWTTFCGARLHVAPGVYVPRPQTEALARRAARVLPRSGVAVDLCTGTGAVAAHLVHAVPDASVVGVDIDARAVRCARGNGVHALVSDLAAAVHAPGAVDVVTAVAPYVPTDAVALLPVDVRDHEPTVALDGGADGLDVVRRVVDEAARLLRPGGWLLVEVGGDQVDTLTPDLAMRGYVHVTGWRNAEGDLRGIAARMDG